MAASRDLTALAQKIKSKIPFPDFFRQLYPNQRWENTNAQCPYHADDKASFQVEKDHGYCHAGCMPPGGKTTRWDIFALYQMANEVDFKTAVHDLATGTGLAEGNGNRPEGRWEKRVAVKAIVATYDYRDEAGELLYQVARFEPKSFRQSRPDGRGGWIWNLNGVQRVLFRLQEVIAADIVWVCEGERDALTLAELGLCGTSSPQGAGKWSAVCRDGKPPEALRGKHVVIIPDNDGPGKKHAQDVAESLTGVAASVKVLELPGLAEKQDVTDFITKHGPDEAKRLLLELAESTPEYHTPEPSPQTEPSIENLTDMGNASRMARLHGADIRYCSELGWLVWDGTRWIPDKLNIVQRKAKETVRAMYAEAAALLDDNQRRALVSHARKSESSLTNCCDDRTSTV